MAKRWLRSLFSLVLLAGLLGPAPAEAGQGEWTTRGPVDLFGDPNLLPGINLELWGVPTSRPAYDPRNRDFVYQRFQRGVMQYDAGCDCTNGLLLADYLKRMLTGNPPGDVAAQAAGSPFLGQYNRNKPNWVDRPDRLADTDLTAAFEPR